MNDTTKRGDPLGAPGLLMTGGLFLLAAPWYFDPPVFVERGFLIASFLVAGLATAMAVTEFAKRWNREGLQLVGVGMVFLVPAAGFGAWEHWNEPDAPWATLLKVSAYVLAWFAASLVAVGLPSLLGASATDQGLKATLAERESRRNWLSTLGTASVALTSVLSFATALIAFFD